MNGKTEGFFLKTVLLLVVASMFPLLTIPVFAGEKTWDISYQPEPFVVPLPIGPGIEIDISISLDASGTVRVTNPAGVPSTVTVPENDIGFSHIFPMPEIGQYSITETYTLVFRSLNIVIDVEYFTRTDEWKYDNPGPSLMKFCLEDMYVYDYSITITPANTLEVVSITPSPAKPGDKGIMKIRTLRNIQMGEIITFALTAKWYKKSSLTPVPDNIPPSISHTPVQSILVGLPISAQITDNLKVDSATLYFKDASSSGFLPIPMTPTGQPNTYEGYIPIAAKGGNGSYYFEATDLSNNKTTFPASPYSILVKSFGDVNGDGLVSAIDADLVLRNAVGLIPFSDEQRYLGDVSGDGTGSSYDAGLILQYADGLIDTFPVQNGGTSSLDSAMIQAAVTLSVPDLTGLRGSNVIVPINTSSASGLGIIGIDITLAYDSSILPTVIGVTKGATTPTWAIAYNVVNGQVIIGMANSTELTGEGVIVNVEFGISGQATGGQTSLLDLANVSLNEGGVSADTTDGTLTVIEQIDIDLHQGWNLFSICLQVEDNSISSVLEPVEGSYESVWTLGSWKQYFPDDPSFPGGLDVIMHGEGYWIDMEADDTLTITGVRLANTTIPLEEGWNLVGYNHPEEMNVEDAQLFTPGDNTAIYTYEEGVWKKYLAGDTSSFNDLDRFKPGKGYYIYVTSGRQWVIP